MDSDHGLEINGDVPDLSGIVCHEIVIQEHWYDGAINDRMNVAWVSTDGGWYRIYFDYGIVFFRGPEADGPAPFVAPELDSEFKNIQVARGDLRITSALQVSRLDNGDGSIVVFDTGKGKMTLTGHDSDENSWLFAAGKPQYPQQDGRPDAAKRRQSP
jgi:hypothetical protein